MRRNAPDYKKEILCFISGKSQPFDVENIRVGCGIGNWMTALKCCLELVLESKIMGAKTSKSWIFWGKALESNTVPRGKR